MPLYETTFITRQDVSVQDVAKITGTFSELLVSQGGKIIKTEQWGLKDLAYVIKKNSKAYYTMLGIDAPVEALKELERKLDLNEDILRYMSIKVEQISPKPSAPMLKFGQANDEQQSDAPVSGE